MTRLELTLDCLDRALIPHRIEIYPCNGPSGAKWLNGKINLIRPCSVKRLAFKPGTTKNCFQKRFINLARLSNTTRIAHEPVPVKQCYKKTRKSDPT